MSEIRLLIADDHYVTRSGLVAMANKSPILCVAGVESEARSTLSAAADLSPDVVLINLRRLGGSDLKRLIGEIDCPNVIVLRSEGSQLKLKEILQAQVSGYADLDAVQGDLASIIAIVSRGCSVCIFTESKLRCFSGTGDDASGEPGDEWLRSLTDREVEVLKLIANGMTNREISARLHVSETTVKKHASRIMRKLGVTGRVEAALQFARLEHAVNSGG
ncbi:MAG: response regulator transcription factor [Pseudonocardia sp.]|nr:response regulator transcription factor [Pseudonocardia sp.]